MLKRIQRYPVGDDRNKESSDEITFKFKICPTPCDGSEVKYLKACQNGIETDDTESPNLVRVDVYSTNGEFSYSRYLHLNGLCPTGNYRITFITPTFVHVEVPPSIEPPPNIGLQFIQNYFVITQDITMRMFDPPYTLQEIFTIESYAWQGTWLPGDYVEFYITKNNTTGFEAQTLTMEMCPKIGNNEEKCLPPQKVIEFCLCPSYEDPDDKCGCNYSSPEGLHWYILKEGSERFAFYWTNPETCCVNWVELRATRSGGLYGMLYLIELTEGSRYGTSYLRNQPPIWANILGENDERWQYYTLPNEDPDDDGWICDRLRWDRAYSALYAIEGYYKTEKTTSHGMVPGEGVTLWAAFDDVRCNEDGIILDFTWLETIGLIGGEVLSVVSYETGTYRVSVKGIEVQVKSSDFTRYDVGEWVALQKTGASPMTGFPSDVTWPDRNGNLHEPEPYLTDQNVTKIDPTSSKLVYFESKGFLPSGYYGTDYIGHPTLDNRDQNDLVGKTVKITSGSGNPEEKTIMSVTNGKLYVGTDWNIRPQKDSQFTVYYSSVYDMENTLKIIPYDFKYE